MNAAGCQTLADRDRKYKLRNAVHCKRWLNSIIVGAETTMLLDLFEVLHRKVGKLVVDQ